jgi:predicted TPR repeat methyltransferase
MPSPPAPPTPLPTEPAPESFERARRSFVQGLEFLESGHAAQAEQCFLSSLELLPRRISTLVNLAAARIDLGRPQDALLAIDEVLALEPDNLDAWFHRGTACGLLDRNEDALASFERLLSVEDGIAEPWLRHGQVLQSLKRPEEALASYDRALAIDPALAAAWTNRGGILQELRRFDQAAEAFRQALASGGDPELNRYYLASVGGTGAPPGAPASYVRTLFDDYADQFDEHLVKVLGYRAHTALAGHLAEVAPRRFRSALDLGCGTGLCAPQVAQLADRLTGVDLSRQMLDRAAARRLYQRLVQADITQHLQETSDSHDLVLAADVFIYIGELAPIFSGARRLLEPGGVFCFSVEVAAPECSSFELLPSLRYAHSEPYLRRLAADHAFEVAGLFREPLREDQRETIDGLLVYLTAR